MKLNHFYSYYSAVKEIKKENNKLTKEGWVVENDLYLHHFDLWFLPSFEKVNRNFYCYGNQLTSLKGAPKEIDGDFNCCNNPISDYSELKNIKTKGIIYK